jgi:hypothetical protein
MNAAQARYIKIRDTEGPDDLINEIHNRFNFPFIEGEGPWIAGGLIRRIVMGETLGGTDVDIFFASTEQFEECGAVGPDAVQVGGEILPVSYVMTRYYKTAEDVLDDFIFTACQFAMDGQKLVMGRQSIQHNHEKILVPVSPKGGFLKIVNKYVDNYGFSLSPEMQARLDNLDQSALSPSDREYVHFLMDDNG